MFRYWEQTKHHKLAQVEPVVEFVPLPKYLEDLLGDNVVDMNGNCRRLPLEIPEVSLRVRIDGVVIAKLGIMKI